MQQFFIPEDNAAGSSYARDYHLYVEDDLDCNKVRVGVTDSDRDTAMAELTTDRAREVAKALVEAAELIGSQPVQVGDLNPTASQLDSLPKGSVVRFDDPQFNGSRFALKANNAILDQWVTDSGADWGSSTLATRVNTKIIFIPEETA